MKNKGFTLIELLAVIVILAIIALIATPVVLNIIKDSKNSSVERSAELYLDQVKNEIARYNMTHPSSNFNPSECTVQNDDSLICDGTSLNIEIKGDKPSAGSKILLSNGSITGLEDFKIGSKNLTYENGKIKEEDGSTSKPICTAVTTATTGNVPTGSFNYGDEYTCDVGDGEEKTFFVLETSGDNVNLIMNANVGSDGKIVTSSSTNKSTVAWVTKEDYIAAGGTESDWNSVCTDCGNNNKGPITVIKALNEYTSTWANITKSQITLPTAGQIATASGQAFDQTSSIKNLPVWLYDYLNETTHPVSGLSGYWTITPRDYHSCYAWNVFYDGTLNYNPVNITSFNGVRPVITLSKSLIE